MCVDRLAATRFSLRGVPIVGPLPSMGRKAGERVLVEVSPDYSYYIQIKNVVKGADDESLPISAY